MPNAPPPRAVLRSGALIDYEGLRDAAAEAVENDGRTQQEIAEALDKHPSTVSNAVNQTGRKVEKLQRLLIESLTPYRVGDTLFRLTRE